MTGRDVLSFLRSSGTVREMRELDPQLTEWALSRRWLTPRGEQRARRNLRRSAARSMRVPPITGTLLSFDIKDF